MLTIEKNRKSLQRIFVGVLILMGTFLSEKAYSQEEASIWYFGDHAGLDFSSGSPTLLNNSAMDAGEGCSTISDHNGNLLFYTNGVKVYNKNHQVMENGGNLLGSNSSSQAAIIIPKPESTYIYYIFTTNSFDGGGFDYGLNYYEVNMLANGGLGSVTSVNGASINLPPSAVVPLATPVSEKLTAVYNEEDNAVWVLAHLANDSQDFLAYKVTENGVNTTPIVSSVGAVYPEGWLATAGCMKLSPDGRKLAVALGSTEIGGVEFFDFNSTTGVVSNFRKISTSISYGVEFSNDSKVLYVTNANGTGNPNNAKEISQYDVSSDDLTTIQNSKTIITGGEDVGNLVSLQLGIDGKIYAAIAFGTHYLHVINNPNMLGMGCDFVSGAINLEDNASKNGLPNYITSYFDIYRNHHEIYACENSSTVLISNFPGQAAYVWSKYNPDTDTYDAFPDETDPSLTVTVPGEYKLDSYANNGDHTEETFTVHVSPSPEIDLASSVATTSLCAVNNLTLDASPFNANELGTFTYVWSDDNGELAGETNATLTVSSPGTYSVEVMGTIEDEDGNFTGYSCTSTDQLTITEANFTVALGNDQNLCDQSSYELTAAINGADATGANYTWTGPNGPISENTPAITVSDSGTYSVTVDIDGCTASDEVELSFENSPIITLGDDQVTCSLNGLELDATPTNFSVAQTTFEWTYQNNPIPETGPIVIPSNYGYGAYEVTAYANNSTCVSVTSVTLEERQGMSVTISTNDNDNLFCIGETAMLTAEIENIDSSVAQYQWFEDGMEIPGETAQTLTLEITDQTTTSTYTVEVTEANCIVSAETELGLYEGCEIPRGISPGTSIGINDCLDLAFLADRSGIKSLKLYSRYGRRVFEQKKYIDTWCGQDENGNDLPTGTYYYVIEMKKEDPVFGNVRKGWIYINR